MSHCAGTACVHSAESVATHIQFHRHRTIRCLPVARRMIVMCYRPLRAPWRAPISQQAPVLEHRRCASATTTNYRIGNREIRCPRHLYDSQDAHDGCRPAPTDLCEIAPADKRVLVVIAILCGCGVRKRAGLENCQVQMRKFGANSQIATLRGASWQRSQQFGGTHGHFLKWIGGLRPDRAQNGKCVAKCHLLRVPGWGRMGDLADSRMCTTCEPRDVRLCASGPTHDVCEPCLADGWPSVSSIMLATGTKLSCLAHILTPTRANSQTTCRCKGSVSKRKSCR